MDASLQQWVSQPCLSPGFCRACFVGVAIAGIQKEDGVLSLLKTHILDRFHLPGPESSVNMSQWLRVLTSAESIGLPSIWEPLPPRGQVASSSVACRFVDSFGTAS